MRLLLDAHTLIWAVDDPAKLGAQAAPAVQDPAFDRLLVAQAQVEKIALVSRDIVFDQYGTRRLW